MDRARKIFVPAAFLCLFLFAVINATHGSLLSYSIDFFGLTSQSQGYAASAQNAGCLGALLVSLLIANKISKVRILWISTGLMILCLLPIGFLKSFPGYVAMFCLMGLFMGLSDTASSGCISDCYTGRTASRMMGALHAIFGLAGIVCPPLYSTYAAASGTWRSIYLILFGIGALSMIYISYASENWIRTSNQTKAAAQKFTFSLVPEFLRDWGRTSMLLQVFLFSTAFGALQVWCERYVGNTLGGKSWAAFMLPLFWLALAISRLGIGFVVKNPLRYLRYAPLVSAISLAAGVLSGSVPVAVAGIVGMTLSGGAMVPMTLSTIGPKFEKSTLVGTMLTFLMVYVGQMIGPTLAGALDGAIGLSNAMLVMAGISAAATAVGVAARKAQ